MGEAAGIAARTFFPSITTLKIVRWDATARQFVSFDVVSGRKVEVPEGAEWDDVRWVGAGLSKDLVGQGSEEVFDESI